MKAKLLILFVLFITFVSCGSIEKNQEYEQVSFLVEEGVKSLQKFLDYMGNKLKLIPIDTTFVLKSIEGLFKDSPYPVLQSIGKRAGKLSKIDEFFQKKLHKSYYDEFKKLLKKSYLPRIRASKGKLPPPKPVQIEKKRFSEKASDYCLTHALNCVAPKRCVPVTNFKGTKGYTLTHSILYGDFLLRCKNLSKKVRKHIKKDMMQKLSNMLKEAKEDNKWSDVGVERWVIGLMMGRFKEFYSTKMLANVIKRQTTAGCWEDGEAEDNDETSTLVDYDSFDNCSFHTSGLAAYYIAAILAHFTSL